MKNFKIEDGSTNRKPSTFEELMVVMTTPSNNPQFTKECAEYLFQRMKEEDKLKLDEKMWQLRKDKCNFVIYKCILVMNNYLVYLVINNQNLLSYTSKLLVKLKSLI